MLNFKIDHFNLTWLVITLTMADRTRLITVTIGSDLYTVYETKDESNKKLYYLMETDRFMNLYDRELLKQFLGITVKLRIRELGVCNASMVPFLHEAKILLSPCDC